MNSNKPKRFAGCKKRNTELDHNGRLSNPETRTNLWGSLKGGEVEETIGDDEFGEKSFNLLWSIKNCIVWSNRKRGHAVR